MPNNKNIYLYIAIALPILMIAITYIGLGYNNNPPVPKNNFLYALVNSDNVYNCGIVYKQKLYAYTEPNYARIARDNANLCLDARFYIYNFKTNNAQNISFAAAQKLALDPLISSDGYGIENYCNADINFFWNGNFNSQPSVCIVKKRYRKMLEFNAGAPDVNYSFVFLGWIS